MSLGYRSEYRSFTDLPINFPRLLIPFYLTKRHRDKILQPIFNPLVEPLNRRTKNRLLIDMMIMIVIAIDKLPLNAADMGETDLAFPVERLIDFSVVVQHVGHADC